jgi:hypothetical protein
MFRISLLCLFSVAALAQPPAGRQIMSGSGTVSSGVTIRYKTMAVPAGIDWSGLGEGGISIDANSIHRDMIDKRSGTYFGYDLVIGSGDAVNGYVATFQPLSSSAGMVSRGGAILTRAPEPKFPPPQVLHDGDLIVLDLMVSLDGKQKVTDYIEFLARAPEPAGSAAGPAANAEPRDFTVDDGPVTFQAERVAVWIDGQKVSGTLGFTGKPGATFWIAFPGQGRYILSLVPHDGLIKSGALRDNAIAFQDGGRNYEVRFMGPIAGAGKAWNLYLLHDPTYTPDPKQRLLINTGTDRLENLLPKR